MTHQNSRIVGAVAALSLRDLYMTHLAGWVRSGFRGHIITTTSTLKLRPELV